MLFIQLETLPVKYDTPNTVIPFNKTRLNILRYTTNSFTPPPHPQLQTSLITHLRDGYLIHIVLSNGLDLVV